MKWYNIVGIMMAGAPSIIFILYTITKIAKGNAVDLIPVGMFMYAILVVYLITRQ